MTARGTNLFMAINLILDLFFTFDVAVFRFCPLSAVDRLAPSKSCCKSAQVLVVQETKIFLVPSLPLLRGGNIPCNNGRRHGRQGNCCGCLSPPFSCCKASFPLSAQAGWALRKFWFLEQLALEPSLQQLIPCSCHARISIAGRSTADKRQKRRRK